MPINPEMVMTLSEHATFVVCTDQYHHDMVYEVACPCGCHGATPHGPPCAAHLIAVSPEECGVCAGTGRVPLGRIVELDRARKAKQAETVHG